MQVSTHPAPVPWADYATFQEMSDRCRRISDRSWALEDEINSWIDRVARSEPVDALGLTSNTQRNLGANRRKKHRRRGRLLRIRHFPTCRGYVEDMGLQILCDRDKIERLRGYFTDFEWSVFLELARGDDYAAIAARRNLTVPAIKSRIWKTRRRAVGGTLRDASRRDRAA
jgi:hypothetical protein